MNRTENNHNHIQDCINNITKEDLKASDMRMLASQTIELFKNADKTMTEERGSSLLISALRDKTEEENLKSKKDSLIISGIVWHALDTNQKLWIEKKLHTYNKLPGIHKDEMRRIKVRFTTFIDKLR